MYHLDHSSGIYDVAILLKESALKETPIKDHYLSRINTGNVISFSLDFGGKKKPSAVTRRTYLDQLLPKLSQLGINYLVVTDGEYFKTLTKENKTEPHHGLVLPCKYPNFEHFFIVLCTSYQALNYNPDLNQKIDLSMKALNEHMDGQYSELGSDIIHFEDYPDTPEDIQVWLNQLHQYPELYLDLETFSLKHYLAGLGTCSISWSKHEGIAFCIDYVECAPYEVDVWDKKDKKFKTRVAVARKEYNAEVRAMFKEFLQTYKGKVNWHNAGYDCTVLVYQLWMDSLIDHAGLLTGLEVVTKNMDDTKLITYLATNSCVGNKLSLKDQAHEFAGNYAVTDINDIRLIPKAKLLKYNLVDTLSTCYVKEKNYPTMVQDSQEELYKTYFLPFLKDIIQMQLTGMVLDMDKVLYAESELDAICTNAHKVLHEQKLVQEFIHKKRLEEVELYNTTRKKARITIDKAKYTEVNLNSGKQIQDLLYNFIGLPVIELTDTKEPATGGKVLKALLNHTDTEENLVILNSLIEYSKANKVLTAFIPVFKEAPLCEDGCHRVFGNLNLGGTVSGRLSSNNPNLQNLPSGSTFGKLIKDCFVAPKGWVFGGADSASLEDRISALTTKDPNKLNVYIRGFDGHCLRTVNYWPHLFPDVDPDNVEQVNGIQDTEFGNKQRGKSKGPTFSLTYLGTWMTLVRNNGFPPEEAKAIEANYHKLYVVSDQWVKTKLNQAAKDGYITAAFGLRVRTPLLKRSIMGSRVTPKEASAEERTAGNALGQSWCLLNSRAANEFMDRVRKSKYRLDIRVCNLIHDAVYIYWRDCWDVTHWVNQNLGECMAWQDHPDIWHDEVKLFGELDIFYPSWKYAITLKNNISKEELVQTVLNERNKRIEKLL